MAGPSLKSEEPRQSSTAQQDGVQEANGSSRDEPDDAGEEGLNFKKEFNVYLTELEPPSEGHKNPASVRSRLITFETLQERASQEGLTLRRLPLSKLRSIHQGFFCLFSSQMVQVDSSLSLSEYAQRERKAAKPVDDAQSLTVYWTRAAKHKLDDVLTKIPEPFKPDEKTEDLKRDPEFPPEKYVSALKTEQSLKMDKPSELDTPYTMSQKDWSFVIEGNELLCAFQVDTDQTRRLRTTKLSAYLTPNMEDDSKSSGDSESKTTPESQSQDKEKPAAQTVSGAQPDPSAQPTAGPTSQPATLQPDGQPATQPIPQTDGQSTKQPTPQTPVSNAGPASNTKSASSKVTRESNVDPIVPIRRCTRPVFMIHPESGIGSTKKGNGNRNAVSAGLFWTNCKSVSTTEIAKVQSSVQAWSLQSGMSSRSMGGGLSFPIGKATVGAKAGFEREQSGEHVSEEVTDKVHFTVVHTVPTVQINLNETTVLLSPDAESDIKKLRKGRKFSDLLSFLDKYGTVVYQNTTLGGRLHHTQESTSEEKSEQDEQKDKIRKSANASLGIPDKAEVKINYSSKKSDVTKTSEEKLDAKDFLTWSGIGGNPGLTVDPPKWRDSLNHFSGWRPIQYENPVRVDEFIGRLRGFSDVPVLFSSILASGVLDRSVITLPPNGLQSLVKGSNGKSPQVPQLGTGVVARTGDSAPGLLDPQPKTSTLSEAAPEGFSWAVFCTDRDVKREINASLRSSLNVAVNLSYRAPFLTDLLVNAKSFSIMLRWTSRTLKDTWQEDERAKAKAAMKDILDKDVPKVPRGGFFIRSFTTRAWVVGIWTVQQGGMPEADFDDLRRGVAKHFSEPRQIEEGCDYLAKVAAQGACNKSLRGFFQLQGSDSVKNDEVVVQPWTSPAYAFDTVDRRMRLSSIHALRIKAEVEPLEGQKLAPAPLLRESALVQIQETWASALFLRSKIDRTGKGGGKRDEDLAKQLKTLEDRIESSRDKCLFDAANFDAAVFAKLDELERKLNATA